MGSTTLGTVRRNRIAGLATAVAGLGLLVSACSGPAGTGSSAPATTTGSRPATVETHSGPVGNYLTDGTGKSLYLFANDKGQTSSCTGACAQFWPPLTTTGSPKGSGQVQSSDLSTTRRSDGSSQVTYHGHPLYYFVQDQAAGDTKGQGLNQDGGLWWLVTPNGAALTKTGGARTSSPATSGGAGGWA